MKKSDLLSPLSSLYGTIIDARRAFYEKGIYKSSDLGVPTISIGNITVGGTGKTPLVAFTAQTLAEKGEKVCILTRGYRRENERERVIVSDGKKILADARQAGDEPFELAQKLISFNVAVIADANRAEAGKWARENFGITAFVLDDGFQHLQVKRDLDIICIDATNPFGNEKTLPAGILREPLKNLKRADAVVITRANLVDKKQLSALKNKISKYNQNATSLVSENKTTYLIELQIFHAKLQEQKCYKTDDPHSLLTSYLAFCALGNPRSFFEQLKRENFKIASTKEFPDHYIYKQKDIDELETLAKTAGAEAFLTTVKDSVKLKELKFDLPCFIVESGLIFDNEEELKKLILGVGYCLPDGYK